MNGRQPVDMSAAATDDEAFDQSLLELLRDSEGNVDFVTATRLRAARVRAVEAARGPARAAAAWWTVPGAAISAAMLVWMLVPGRIHAPSSGDGAATTVPPVEVIETLADDKTTGVYDDLEFYQWLADTDGHG